jgi:hypothetical protein
MNTRRIAIAYSLLAFSFLTIASDVHAVTQSLSGVISDSMCVKKHMMPGKSDAECIRECIKSGSAYVLVVGEKTYMLKGNATVIAPFAAKRATVQGTVNQKTITVDAIH